MDTHLLLRATDLTDAEWALLEPLLPPDSPIGRPRLRTLRTILLLFLLSIAFFLPPSMSPAMACQYPPLVP